MGAMPSSDELRIKVIGRGTHAARRWAGIDPIIVTAEIQLGLQTIISRQTNISKAPAVITIGMIHGGTRYNVIPDTVQMDGTIRAFDQLQRWRKLSSTRSQLCQSSTHMDCSLRIGYLG
jgi:metal-dependent amidase/aminoacylase/carboxypeptidase family protein